MSLERCVTIFLVTRFYTKQGDYGTSILGSKKVSKDDPIFAALGNLDELNSWLAVCRTEAAKLKNVSVILKSIQESLFIAQAEIASVGMGYQPKIKMAAVRTSNLEKEIEKIDQVVPEITKFIIPGGCKLSTQLDFARAIARRAERGIRKYDKIKKLRPELLQYINRLSSILFALARFVNYKLRIKEENPNYK